MSSIYKEIMGIMVPPFTDTRKYHEKLRGTAKQLEDLKKDAPCSENKEKLDQAIGNIKEVADEVESVVNANPYLMPEFHGP